MAVNPLVKLNQLATMPKKKKAKKMTPQELEQLRLDRQKVKTYFNKKK